jgi:hypothetical protein
MYIVVDYTLFLAGVIFGILWFSVIALPLLYGVPRSTWWGLRGRLKWPAIRAGIRGALDFAGWRTEDFANICENGKLRKLVSSTRTVAVPFWNAAH